MATKMSTFPSVDLQQLRLESRGIWSPWNDISAEYPAMLSPWTGTFAETAIVDYRLSFADQGKTSFRFLFAFAANKRKFSASVFRLQKTHGSCHFLIDPFSVCGKHGGMETWKHRDIDMETWKHGEIETWRHGHRDRDIKWRTENGSPGDFS
jgi:hypothetical protein